MDRLSEKLILSAERHTEDADALVKECLTDEGAVRIDDEKTARKAVRLIWLLREHSKAIVARRIAKNAKAQQTIKKHTGWFGGVTKTIERLDEQLREGVERYLMPAGEPGNVDTDALRLPGEGDLGVASFADLGSTVRITNEEAFIAAHPDLCKLVPDMLKVTAYIDEHDKLPQHTKTVTSYQLRIT